MLEKIKDMRGRYILVSLSIIPVIIWLINFGFGSPFASIGIFVASLGKAAALAGITLFCLNPLLSMRHHLVEVVFGSLDKVYRIHVQSGKISFVLITAHPFFLGIGRLIGGKSISTIWDWTSILLITGYLSFLILLVVTATSIYSHIRHQNWVLVHHLFGWLIPLFFLHSILARSQMTKIPELFGYLLFIGSIGFSAFLYRSVYSKHFTSKHAYVVADANHVSDSVIEFVLKPTGIPISFQAGQFAYASFDSPGVDPEFHPFSFSNANNGPYVRFAVKALGDDTKNIQKVTEGSKVYLDGPYGAFSYRKVKNPKQVWIAGGIGITPFLSMARSFSGKKHYNIHFFYGTESLDEAIFLQEFIDITRQLPDNFDTKVIAKNLTGFVTIDLLKASLGSLEEYDYFICGPPGMMKALKTQLLSAGVGELSIHVESFSV